MFGGFGGSMLGGLAGQALFNKPQKPLPPQGVDDPRNLRSTPGSTAGSTGGGGYGRGSSSLSV